jgi:septum formation protein
MKTVILASRSKRRSQILKNAGIEHLVKPSDIEIIEQIDYAIPVEEAVVKLAKRKAMQIFEERPESIVIGADTIVVVDDHILGVPNGEDDAKRMLRLISGRTHLVYTGVYIVCSEKTASFTSKTEVEFWHLSDEEIEYYVNTGEVFDKAGAYAMSGFASKYVKQIKGDYYGVIGMPVCQLYHILKTFS